MKPPIRYFGGKGTMYKKILDFFPKESFSTYIEPFGGSFSVGFKVLDKFPCLIYNDVDRNVYCLYEVLKDPIQFDIFKERLDLMLYSEDLREECRTDLKREDLSDLDRAIAFFYVNRTSHNGIGGMSINSLERRKMSKSISDYLSAIDRLPELHQAMSKVIILNRDGIDLIQKFDREDIFMYLDPPYEQSTRTEARYKEDMNREGHERLLDVLLNIKKAKWLLSGYSCELYDRLKTHGIYREDLEIKTQTGTQEKKTKIETLWRNYEYIKESN